VAAEYIRIAATLPETVPAVGNPRRVINTPLGAPAAARTVRVCLAQRVVFIRNQRKNQFGYKRGQRKNCRLRLLL